MRRLRYAADFGQYRRSRGGGCATAFGGQARDRCYCQTPCGERCLAQWQQAAERFLRTSLLEAFAGVAIRFLTPKSQGKCCYRAAFYSKRTRHPYGDRRDNETRTV